MRLLPGFDRSSSGFAASICLLLGGRLAAAIALNGNDSQSVRKAAGLVADNLITYYPGPTNNVGNPGLLDFPPYYWWESGAFWMTLVTYWWYTGDSQYNSKIMYSIQANAGPDANFILDSQSFDNGNDDQAFWAFAAMEAAELKFPNPPPEKPQWLALAQAVYNVQLTRFTKTCGGGLPWQVYSTTPGYTYKNAISNGCFIALAARLQRYTGNSTYGHYAETTWNWAERSGIIGTNGEIWDGVDTLRNCKVNGVQWTYNAGVFLLGAANMWNHTREPIWKERINKIIGNLPIFFQDGVMWEQWCEDSAQRTCNTDQQSFKSYLARWMAITAQLAPWTYDTLMPLLQKSAAAAAEVCVGGPSNNECGFRWTINNQTGKFDGQTGAGEQLAAMSVIGTLMTQREQVAMLPKNHSIAPVTHVHGISKGNSSAGLGGSSLDGPQALSPAFLHVTTADRAGAWILTVIMALLTIGGGVWALWDDNIFSLRRGQPKRSPARSIKAMTEKVSGHVSPLISGVKTPAKIFKTPSKPSAQSTAPASEAHFTPSVVRSPTQRSVRSAADVSVRSFRSAEAGSMGAGWRPERPGGGIRSPARLSINSQTGLRSSSRALPPPPPSPIGERGTARSQHSNNDEAGPGSPAPSSPAPSRLAPVHFETEPRSSFHHG